MSSTRSRPQDFAWNLLYRIRKRPVHEPREMRSAQSVPPIKAWICDDCAPYTGLVYTYVSSDATPICYGSNHTLFPQEPVI